MNGEENLVELVGLTLMNLHKPLHLTCANRNKGSGTLCCCWVGCDVSCVNVSNDK